MSHVNPPSPSSTGAAQKAAAFAANSRAAGTTRGYARDFADFAGWCAAAGLASLPASEHTIGCYLAASAGRLKPATLERRLSAILVTHRQAGFALDRRAAAIADVLAGIRRTLGTAPAQKAALEPEDVRDLVAALPDTLMGLRDKALILLGFAGGFRRGELAALRLGDLVFTSEGLAVVVRRGKEDQEGAGFLKGIGFGAHAATCPVRAVRRWILAARLSAGPLFIRCDRHGNPQPGAGGISGQSVALILKRAAEQAGRRRGWNRAQRESWAATLAGTSLRAGYVTTAAEAGRTSLQICDMTGHKTGSRALARYIRKGNLFRNGGSDGLGL